MAFFWLFLFWCLSSPVQGGEKGHEKIHVIATLTLGLQPRQKGYKVTGQEEAWESKQRGRKGAD
jgi:hypothetical protein